MRYLSLALIFGLLISCNRTDFKTLFERYNEGYYSKGFNSIASMLADSVKIKDVQDYEVTYSIDEFKIFYQWDSTFHPENKVTIIEYTDTTIDYIEERYSKRFEFLEHNPLIMRQRIHFSHGKISKFENREYLNFNVKTWTSNRDSLVSWIDRNHPELSGFIFDLTKEGAINYLKAIELYKNAM